MLRHVIHDHTLHKTLHQIYIFLSETGMQSEKIHAPDKSFRKIFGKKKEDDSDKSEFLENLKSQPVWHQSCKSNQIDKHDKVKSATRLAVKVKSR